VRILAGLVILVLSLSAVVGCSRGKGGPPQPQPTAPTAQPAETKPAKTDTEPEPEPEPAPGEVVRLAPPKDGGAWPWAVGKTELPGESRPVTFNNIAPHAITGLAVRPDVNRAVVSIRVDPTATKKGPSPLSTRVALIDTAAGTTLPAWVLPGAYAVLDLSPDGRGILATYPQPGRDRGVLRLWVAGTDGQLKRWNCTAHAPPREGLRLDSANQATESLAHEIRWAAFVGDRVVSASRGGQVRVFDTEGLKPLAGIDATPCRPAVTPDGAKVAFLIGSHVALLDPAARKIVGMRWVGTPPPHPVLAFSPDGAKLAIGGNGRLVLLDLTSGHFQSVTIPRLDVNDNGVYDKPFGWAGPDHILADRLLFDPQLPQPVWSYSGAEILQGRGWRTWASVRASDRPATTVRAFTLPAPETLGAVAAAKAKPGAAGLRPGGGVRIDVTGVPEDRREETQAALAKRLREVGFVPDEKAEVTLFASVDSPGTKPTVVYTAIGSYSYTRKPTRLRLVLNGKELWNDAWAVEPPFAFDYPKGTVLVDQLAKLGIGQPDYKAFTLAPFPSHLPGPNAPATAIGTTDLAATHTGG
jgi:hypothetical protein